MATAAAQDGPKNGNGGPRDGGNGPKRRNGGKDGAHGRESVGSGGRDLTGRARIRNAGLHLFATNGFAGTPLRSIAAEAGVAIGLISHHFGSKDGLREAVESWIIDLFDTAIDSADQQSVDPVADAAGRDAAVARMLEDHPLVVDYLRRELLESPDDRPLLARLVALTRESVDAMRATGLASSDRDRVEQVVTVMVRQLGKLFLQPLVDQIVDAFPAEERPAASPELSIEVNSARH